MTIVRAAITQTTWTGDKASMLDKHEGFAREAAAQGAAGRSASRNCSTARTSASPRTRSTTATPNRPTVRSCSGSRRWPKSWASSWCFRSTKRRRPGVYYNTTVLVDADGTILGKYRKNHIPNLEKFWEKFYFRPGNLGYPVFDTAVGKVGMYICYDRHFPEGWRELGLNGAHMVFNPNATKPGLSQPPVGGRAARGRGRERLLRRSQPNRVGLEDNEYGDEAVNFYGTQPGRRPARQLRRRARLRRARGDARPRPQHGHGARDARRLAVLPRPPPRVPTPRSLTPGGAS